ncbi:uncharacterized protein [Coffea arabica]|uniref:Heme-binding protein 2-like n=1 Tax=Coffea arabica TaxID=13443 RepID=A0ABM4WBF6_COFAR|nr:heme-binding protein 2-like [Coffea arabica]
MEELEEKTWMLMILKFLIILLTMINYVSSIESPEYRVILRYLESDVEIRLYEESFWVSAAVRNATSFEKSTKDGFHRVYQYIRGANLNSSQMVITAPILTTIVPGTHGSDCYVKFYLPAKYAAAPPLPKTELNLQFERWNSQCLAVKSFSGFAQDESIRNETQAFVVTLNKIFNGKTKILEDTAIFSIAQYNAPSHLSGRLNEVWLNASAFAVEGCPSF